jgi:hypothetical protein
VLCAVRNLIDCLRHGCWTSEARGTVFVAFDEGIAFIKE